MPEADIGANIRARKRKTVLGVSPKSKRLLRWPEQSYRIEAYRHCRFGPIERRFCPRVWLRNLASLNLSLPGIVNAAATDINIAKASRYRPRRRHHGGNCCIVPLRRVYIATNALPANSRGSLSTASKLHCDYWRSAFGNSLRCGSLISLRNQSVSSTRSAPTATYQCGYRKLKTTCQMTTGGHLNVPCASVLQSEL